MSKYLMAETTTTVTFQAEPEGCDVVLRVLAVGGGGDGDAFSGNAGGSGHVEWSEVTVSSGEKVSLDIGSDGNFGSAGDSTGMFSAASRSIEFDGVVELFAPGSSPTRATAPPLRDEPASTA